MKVLLIEDSPDDALLVVRELKRGYELDWERVDNAATLRAALQRQVWDVITCDWVMPGFGALAALAILREAGVDAPVIIVTGEVGEEFAVTAMRAGAHDFVSKERLARLRPAVERELRETEVRRARQRAERELRESEDRYRDLVEHSHDLICTHDMQGRIRSVNPAPARVLGYSPSELLTMNLADILVPAARDRLPEYFATLRRDHIARGVMAIQTRSGERRLWEYTNTLRTEGVSVPIVRGMAHDVTEQRRAERLLRKSEEYFRALTENALDLVTILEPDGTIRYASPSHEKASGFSVEELTGQRAFDFVHRDDRAQVERRFGEGLAPGAVTAPVQYRFRRKDDSWAVAEAVAKNLLDEPLVGGILVTARDISERVSAAEALHSLRQENEERFRVLVEDAHDAVLLMAEDGRVLYASPAIARLLGYTPDEVIGRFGLSLVAPSDKPRMQAAFDSLLEHPDEPATAEMRLRHRDGTVRWIEAAGRSAVDNPSVRGVVLNLRDVTERKQAAARLGRQVEQQEALVALGQLVLSAPPLQVVFDTAATLAARTLETDFSVVVELLADGETLLSRAGIGWAEGLVGHTAVGAGTASHAGFTLQRGGPVVLHDLCTETRFAIPPVLRGHGVVSGLSVPVISRGRPFGALCVYCRTARSFSRDEVSLLQGLGNTIAAAIQQERAEQMEKHCAAIVASSDDAIVGKTLDGTIVSWNPGAERLYGYRAEEAIGRGIELISPAGRRDEMTAILERLRHGQPVERLETERVHKDGHRLDVTLTVSPIIDADGHVAGVSTIARDTGEAKRAALALEGRVRERTAELEAANRELEAFSYSVSHDLRAPLRAIDAFARLLLEDCAAALDEQGRGYLEHICSSAARMQDLIAGLLDLARLARSTVDWGPVDLTELAASVAAELHDPNRAVELVIAPDLHAYGDRRLLRVALQNLLGNAWKYTSKQPTARIELGAERTDGVVVYFVRDNGAGFDMRFADKLFAPFQRLHDRGEFEGAGIGLATVLRIVQRHGGRVWAAGAPGQGATFSFTLGVPPRDAVQD